MKTLILIVCLPVLLLAILRSELTPWRLISPSEFSAMQARVLALEQQVRQAQQAQVAQAQRPRISDGSWMNNEKYRSALGKTTVIGRP